MPTDAQMAAAPLGGGPVSDATDPGQIGQGYQLGALSLPGTPQGAQTDSMYEAALAALRFGATNQYNQIRRQIGYTDPLTGAYIPGLVETQAMRDAEEAKRGSSLAEQATTEDMQRAGTLFSGYRGTAQARNQAPWIQALADLDVKVPQNLADLYQQAGGISQSYAIGQNQLLADASQRYLDALLAQQYAAGGTTQSGGYTPPPPPQGPDPNSPDTIYLGGDRRDLPEVYDPYSGGGSTEYKTQ